MNDFGEQRPRIICNINKITLPRLFPSLIYISWRFGHNKGKTKPFRGNVHQIEVDHNIKVDSSRIDKHRFNFTVFIKEVYGDFLEAGNLVISTPSIQEISEEKDITHKINSKYGEFQISLSFKIGYYNRKNSDIENMYQKSEMVNAIEDYTTMIQNMKPLLCNDEESFAKWGEKGVYVNSRKIEHSKFALDFKDRIYGIRDQLSVVEQETDRYTKLVVDAFSLLMKQKPSFVTLDFKEELPFSNAYIIPQLGILIAENLRHDDPNVDSTSFALMTICNSFADFIKGDILDKDWILCIASASLFVQSYVKVNRLKEFDVGISFDTVGKRAIIQYTDILVSDLHNYCTTPKTFADKVKKYVTSLKNLHFKESLIKKLVDYVMNNIDFLITRSWIMTVNVFNEDILIGFNSVFPSHQFELINGLLDIIHFSDELVSGFIKVENLHKLLRGQWLADILMKICPQKGYDESLIKTLPISGSPCPVAPNTKQLEESLSFSDDILIDIPEKLPSKIEEN